MAGYNDIFGNAYNPAEINGPSYAPIASFGVPDLINPNSMITPGGFAAMDPVNTGVGGLSKMGGAGGGFGDISTFGKIGMGLQGLQTIGGLISGFGQLSLAKKQFKLQKDVLNTNLNNQIQAYNTSLDDKARSRAVVEGQSDSERDAYIEANKARR